MRILVLAATEHECPRGPWLSAVIGVGPVDAALGAAAAIAAHRPKAVLQVGIAGARAATGLQPPALVLGTRSCYTDLAVPAHFAPRELTPDAALLAAAQTALPQAVALPIGTSGAVGGTRDLPVEAMEGFAVLRAAAQAGVPALELRALSNLIEETDRTRWQFDAAFAALHAAVPAVVRAFDAIVR